MQTTINLDWGVVPKGFIPVAWREPKEGEWVNGLDGAIRWCKGRPGPARCWIFRPVVEDGWELLEQDALVRSQDTRSTDAGVWQSVSSGHVGWAAGEVAGTYGRQLGRSFFIRRRVDTKPSQDVLDSIDWAKVDIDALPRVLKKANE